MTEKRDYIRLSAAGQRVGDDHPKVKLTDKEVEQIRAIHEEVGIGYKRLARWFCAPRATIQKICTYARRNVPVAKFKPIDNSKRRKKNG